VSPTAFLPRGAVRALLALAPYALVACGGGATEASGFPAQPYAAATSDSGALDILVRTNPQPPARGSNDVELTIAKGTDGSPAQGLTVGVQTWMPAMNHGSSTPTVTEEGGGKYLVSDVYLYMPGTWQLLVTFSGALDDHATLTLPVP
jgi:hypothetical protein